MNEYPSGVVLHIPHDSAFIPPNTKDQFVLSDDELRAELIRMTDHGTKALFAGPEYRGSIVAAAVSRLVVDVERFEDADRERMSAKGMGVIYDITSQGAPLRRKLLPSEREWLVETYFRPHHRCLTSAVEDCVRENGRCLIIDGHSFPSISLPYEEDQEPQRPDICIGTDDFHTPRSVAEAFVEGFSTAGFSVAVNRPFSGAIVPITHYQKRRDVLSLLVEVNRGIYLDELTGKIRLDASGAIEKIRSVCQQASWRAFDSVSGRIPLNGTHLS